MNFEIEFLPVGDGSKAGDAIVVRYGTVSAFDLLVIDGGTIDSGKRVVDHIHKYYGPQAIVTHLLVTHSDADHASGAREVLKGLTVLNLWVNCPWAHTPLLLPLFANKNWTETGLRNELIEKFDIIKDLAIILEIVLAF